MSLSEHWLELAARGIHDGVCGCNGPRHFLYYLRALRRESVEDGVAIRVSIDPELFVCGSPEATEAVQRMGDERDALREALDNLAEAAQRFSTLADYTVEVGVEEDFAAALDDASKLLGPPSMDGSLRPWEGY